MTQTDSPTPTGDWTGNTLLEPNGDPASANTPAAFEGPDGKLYISYTGSADNGPLYLAWLDAETGLWSGNLHFADLGTTLNPNSISPQSTSGPSLVCFRETLYLAYVDTSQTSADGRPISFATMDADGVWQQGVTLTGDDYVPAIEGSSPRLAIAEDGSEMFLVYQSASDDSDPSPLNISTSTDGTTWTSSRPMDIEGSTGVLQTNDQVGLVGPTHITQGNLHVLYSGPDSQLWRAAWDPTTQTCVENGQMLELVGVGGLANDGASAVLYEGVGWIYVYFISTSGGISQIGYTDTSVMPREEPAPLPWSGPQPPLSQATPGAAQLGSILYLIYPGISATALRQATNTG